MERPDVYVENPNWEKPQEFTDFEHDHYMREEYNERLRGNDLELYFFTIGRLQQRYNFLCVCVCVSRFAHNYN